MLQRLLSTEQQQTLRQERSLLEEILVLLARLDAEDADVALLKRSLEQLDELFLLVVVGEFNAGKYAPNVGDEVTLDIALEAISK